MANYDRMQVSTFDMVKNLTTIPKSIVLPISSFPSSRLANLPESGDVHLFPTSDNILSSASRLVLKLKGASKLTGLEQAETHKVVSLVLFCPAIPNGIPEVFRFALLTKSIASIFT